MTHFLKTQQDNKNFRVFNQTRWKIRKNFGKIFYVYIMLMLLMNFSPGFTGYLKEEHKLSDHEIQQQLTNEFSILKKTLRAPVERQTRRMT